MTDKAFYLAWVDETDTTWSETFIREDVQVLELLIKHAEGDVPSALVTVPNPGQGILAPSQKLWAWISRRHAQTGVVGPLFFGRLKGLPSDMLGPVVRLELISQAINYLEQKQVVAGGLKVRPNYDPLFLEAARRDDPNAILEGYSKRWHVSRLDCSWSVSDILEGEDGTAIFEQSDVPYDSVRQQISAAPLQGVNVDATLSWTQQASGIVNLGQKVFYTYTGAGLINDWPRPGSQIGGGYSMLAGRAVDYYGVSNAIMYTNSFEYHNNESFHAVGDTMDVSWSVTSPVLAPESLIMSVEGNRTSSYVPDNSGLGGFTVILTEQSQIAIIDPFNPDFHDIPTAFNHRTLLFIPAWRVDTSMLVRYDAARRRSERVRFTLMADVQPVLVPSQSPPLPVEETIRVSAADVGEPLVNVLDWLSVKGQAVSFGQVIYPNQPTIVGGTSYQICTTAGTASDTQPVFSAIPGEQTTDGTVVWTCLGDNLTSTVNDWSNSTYYPVGSVIRPLAPIWARWTELVPPPRLTGTSISRGQICKASNGSYQQCTLPGVTGFSEPHFSSTYGATTRDGQVTWTSLGTALPDGTHYFMATVAGISADLVLPPFNNTENATFSDNTVTWKSLGTAGGFIQVPIEDLSRRSFLPGDRGKWSLEYLICLGRAKLRRRSRVVQISFECAFDRAAELSCRMNATLFDPRLPGGIATGKITSYEMESNGDKTSEVGRVTFECAVGYGGHVSEAGGTPKYVSEGYVSRGYQAYDGSTTAIQGEEVAYSTPVDAPDDDGLVFPLTKSQVVIQDKVWGSVDAQISAIGAVLPSVVRLANLAQSSANNLSAQLELSFNSRSSVELALSQVPIWYDLELRPVTNGPFNTEYQIITSNLMIPQQIDLAAPASP